MLITILAFATAVASLFLVLLGLRSVAQDTASTLMNAAQAVYQTGNIKQKLAFVALWVMIFALSFL